MVMFHRFFGVYQRLGSDLELNDGDPHGRIIAAREDIKGAIGAIYGTSEGRF